MLASLKNRHIVSSLAIGLFALTPIKLEASEIERVPVHSGTGFFVTPEYVITNEHVVRGGCLKVLIQDHNKTWGFGEIVALDADHDLALIHTPKWSRDTAILRSDFEELKVGDKVVAVGFPLETLEKGQEYEVSKARVVNATESFGANWMFQFTHAVKLGYSGGPLLDGVGKVVGVVKGIAHMYETYKVGGKVSDKHSVGQVDEAINIMTLEAFLMEHNVHFYAAKEMDEQWKGLDFTINVQCVVTEDK